MIPERNVTSVQNVLLTEFYEHNLFHIFTFWKLS